MTYQTTPQSKKTIEALWRLEKIILNSLDFNQVVREIVDSVLLELGYLQLGYEIVVLCLIDPKERVLRRISISQTSKAQQALAESPVPFSDIVIPLSYTKNLLIQSVKQKSPQTTTSWADVLTPALPPDECIRIQALVGIKASLILPVLSRNKAIGALIFSMSKPLSRVTPDERDLIRSFSDIVGLAVQNASLYSQTERANLKLKRANRKLVHLDKLKDEFVFIATHELKNPVTAMRGYLSMVEGGVYGSTPPKLKKVLEQLNASNQQLVQLVNDLLQIARAEAKTIKIKTQPTDLSQSVTETLESLKPLADQKKLALVHDSTINIKVMADDSRLKEILNNLVSNAIKYSNRGTITVSHRLEDSTVTTQVSDRGVGISEADQKRLFTRFFRSEEKTVRDIPGTGLGLFIVKQIVEKMGGKIWFESQLGKGSTFSFSLPSA